MASDHMHEDPAELSPTTREMHRAVRSLIEELEAVDWYSQRIEASDDEELKAVLAHNRDEEKEHACMTLEWIRRRDSAFDALLREILFRDGAITEEPGGDDDARPAPSRGPTLAIGSLREEGT
jgi:uncharacterized protein